MSNDMDFTVGGVVRLRLTRPTADDVDVVQRQLGPLRPATSPGAPDLRISFVDSFSDATPLTYVSWDESGFTSDHFYLTRGGSGTRGRTRIRFDELDDGSMDLVCERTVGGLPHLVTLVNLIALSKGVLPLHATAFSYQGVGVLVTGWAKGGKTESLLAFSRVGARYIGDEWIYLSREREMTGLPEPMRLWRWHVEQLPEVKNSLPLLRRTRMTLLSEGASWADRLARRLPPRNSVGSVLRRMAPIVQRQAYTHVNPLTLLGDAESGTAAQVLILATSHEKSTVDAVPISGGEVAARMRASLIEEREPLLRHYRQYLFGFPHRRSQLIDNAEDLECAMLDEIVSSLPAYQLRHPYPCDLGSLIAPVQGLLTSVVKTGEGDIGRLGSDRASGVMA